MAEYMKVAKTSELTPGKGTVVEVNGKKVALFNVGGSFYAIDDTCTHRGGPLSEGELDDKKVTGPGHGAVFDVPTGEVQGPPAPTGVARYNVRVEGADIEVEV